MAGISKKRIKTKSGEKVKYTITYTDIFGKRHTSGYYETIKEAKRDLWKFDEVQTNESVKYGFIFQNFLKKVETTTNIYMRNNQDMIDQAMNKLNGIFEKNQQKISIIFCVYFTLHKFICV